MHWILGASKDRTLLWKGGWGGVVARADFVLAPPTFLEKWTLNPGLPAKSKDHARRFGKPGFYGRKNRL